MIIAKKWYYWYFCNNQKILQPFIGIVIETVSAWKEL